MNQYEHLKNLQKISPSPFQIAKNKLKNAEYKPDYKKEVTEQNIPCDHRTVLSNEIIFELDAKGWPYNYKIAKQIINTLKEQHVPYYIYATGGKGIHISCYFEPLELNKEQKEVMNKAMRYGFSWKHIRLWFIKETLEYAGLNTELMNNKGQRAIVDPQPVSFNELNDGTHLIRCCGGRKQKYDKDTLETETTYKTWIPEEEFKKTKITVTNYNNVQYPPIIETFKINIADLMVYVNQYVTKCETENEVFIESVDLEEGYTNLDCMQHLLGGLSAGMRSVGAQLLSSALIVDKRNDYKEILTEYVNNCDQGSEPFTIHEALNWYNWTKNQPVTFVNHNKLVEEGLCDGNCAYMKAFKKDAYKVLERSDLLERINKHLSNTIAGEKKNIGLIFLLLISSKFDVTKKTGHMTITRPQSIILSSSSSSGKTWVTKQILKLFGQEDHDYFVFSRMTASVLNYFQDVDMTGKILFVEELQGLDRDSNQLRLWISEGTLKLAGVEKKKEDGVEVNRLAIKKNTGQPCFITGTAEDEVDEQMNNRSWIISMDVTKEQNKRVLDFEDRVARGEVRFDEKELRILQDALRELRHYEVIIPFLDNDVLEMPTEDVRVRRDYNKLKTLISCSALLHQRQRYVYKDEEGNEFLMADLEDYEIARVYSKEMLESAFIGLTNQQMEVYNNINNSSWSAEFTVADTQKMMGYSYTKAYSVLKQLEEVGALLSSGREPGKTTVYSINPNKDFGKIDLPDMYELASKLMKNNLSAFTENGVFFDKNVGFLDWKNAKKMYDLWVKNGKNTRFFLKGSPKKIIAKALETGNTEHVPEESDFILTFQNNLLLEVYRARAIFSPGSQKGYFSSSLPKNEVVSERLDLDKIISELPKNQPVLVYDLEQKGITEELLKKLISEGVLMKWKNGEVIVL